ncbi:tetraspanin-15-like [Rutidosis leptorrhynchoides]|uniref:tetraspanin-15-like n=1 Tax=Rutidosis leptorrhynchoides TaxID=125765 RepID=UPI003A9A4AD6
MTAETHKGTSCAAHKEHDKTPTEPSSIKRMLFLLNTLSFLLSFPILFCIVWLLYAREGKCEHLLPLHKLHIGVVVGLIVLFVISNVVVFMRSRFLMLGFIVVMVPLIVILTIGAALIGAFALESRPIPGSPMWLKVMVNNDNNWNAIESCIYNSRTCQDMAIQASIVTSDDFPRRHLSPIQSGCCIPPSICDMKYVNTTYWERKIQVSTSLNEPYDIDCDSWQNSVTKLCYRCYTCKKGFITTLKRKWYWLGVFLVVVTVLLIVSHLLLFLAAMWERYA